MRNGLGSSAPNEGNIRNVGGKIIDCPLPLHHGITNRGESNITLHPTTAASVWWSMGRLGVCPVLSSTTHTAPPPPPHRRRKAERIHKLEENC